MTAIATDFGAMPTIRDLGAFDRNSGYLLERLVFNNRAVMVAVCEPAVFLTIACPVVSACVILSDSIQYKATNSTNIAATANNVDLIISITSPYRFNSLTYLYGNGADLDLRDLFVSG